MSAMDSEEEQFKNNKEQLETLNRRLQTIFLRHRELDMERLDAKMAIQEVEDRANKKMEKMREAFRRQLDELTKSRDDHRKAAEERALEIRRLMDELNKMRAAQQERDMRINQLDDNNRNLRDELKEQNSKNMVLTAAKDNYERENKKLQDALARANVEVEKLNKEADNAVREMHAHKVRADNAVQELEAIRSASKLEITRLKEDLASVSVGKDDIEKRIRADMAEQLDQIILANQRAFDREKQELVAHLENTYEDQLARRRNEILELSARFEAAMAEKQRVDADNDSLKNTLDELTVFNSTLEKRLEDLNDQLTRVRSHPRVDEKDKMITELQRRILEKDQENEQLTALKAKLFSEIKTYQRLLEQENLRFETKRRKIEESIPSIPRASMDEDFEFKAQIGVGQNAFSAPPSTTGTSNTISTSFDSDIGRESRIASISSVDSDGSRIIISNNTDNVLPLAGWKLSMSTSGSEFSFPENGFIEPMSSVDVWIGSGLIPVEGATDNFYWTEEVYQNNSEGDYLRLVDADGQSVDTVSVSLPKGNGCSIM